MQESALSDFLKFLSFASISADSAYRTPLRECAAWLVGRLNAAGLQASLHETAGHPVVLARSRPQPGLPTVLIYGHYDVQPVDPLSLWTHPPFEPHVENGIVTARGAADNKGQILAHILGVEEALRRDGKLPVNVCFLIEGEEEITSPSLPEFLRQHREELKADVVVISDSDMIAPGVPTFTYGLRGVADMELHMTGPSHDLHSGIFGGAVANPVTMLARLIATLHRPDGHVAIEGFYDGVEAPADWEREGWAKLPRNDATILKTSGAPEVFGEAGFTSLERIWARPTAEVNGFYGGYQGEGTKTVLPKEAHAKLTFRLVPGQRGADILEKAARHFHAHCPPGVRLAISPGHAGNPYLVSPHTGYGKRAQEALAEAFPGAPVALIREGGSVPIVADFQQILGIDTLLLGLSLSDCRIHSPNEWFPLAHLEAGIRLNQALLRKIGLPGVA